MRKILITLLLIVVNLYNSQQHILIGDSQTFYIKKHTKEVHQKKSLCKVGIGVTALNKLLQREKITGNITNVVVSIGVNDYYKTSENELNTLQKLLKRKYPNARIYVIKGSRGWGNVKNLTERDVDNYYNWFREHKMYVLKNSIGKGDPHRDSYNYRKIGKELDSLIKFK